MPAAPNDTLSLAHSLVHRAGTTVRVRSSTTLTAFRTTTAAKASPPWEGTPCCQRLRQGWESVAVSGAAFENVFVCANFHEPWHVDGASTR
jgi:hypothetical protein